MKPGCGMYGFIFYPLSWFHCCGILAFFAFALLLHSLAWDLTTVICVIKFGKSGVGVFVYVYVAYIYILM